MIVVGARAWAAGGRALHANVSIAVAYGAPCPVLIVPGDASPLVGGRAVVEGPADLWNGD